MLSAHISKGDNISGALEAFSGLKYNLSAEPSVAVHLLCVRNRGKFEPSFAFALKSHLRSDLNPIF